jgi:peptide/nickel transport system permease protein
MNAETAVVRSERADLWRRFWRAPLAVAAALIIAVIVLGAVFAPWIAPQDPFDPAALDLTNALLPPMWVPTGSAQFPLGTDDQGRDLLSALLYGARISLAVGIGAVAFAVVLGVGLGLMAGWRGGFVETLIMRLADVQLAIPALLIALMVDALARATLSPARHEAVALGVLIFAIGIADWPQYARMVRAATAVQKTLGYVRAAQIIGVRPFAIVIRHILPNVLTSVTVLATLGLALAIIGEATLSFLGVGMPPTTPSLGTLIRIGQNFLFSGEWWIVAFPSLALVILALAVNLLGDWLRDALDPRLR